jgi:hypothetical protein
VLAVTNSLACDSLAELLQLLLRLQGRAFGTPSAGPGPDAGRNREAIGRECVTETGTATRTKRGRAGLLSDSGAAAMSRPFGRKPYGRKPYGRAAAARSGCPASAGRRYPP